MAEIIISKRCSKCKVIKAISEFHRESRRKDGHRASCKICDKQYQQSETAKESQKRTSRKYRQTEKGKEVHRKSYRKWAKSEKGKNWKKKYRQTEKGKISRRKYAKIFSAQHPNQDKAHKAVKKAIKDGRLPKVGSLKCHYCPTTAEEYHHHKGYAPEHWLDVIPACIDCHNHLPIESLCDVP